MQPTNQASSYKPSSLKFSFYFLLLFFFECNDHETHFFFTRNSNLKSLNYKKTRPIPRHKLTIVFNRHKTMLFQIIRISFSCIHKSVNVCGDQFTLLSCLISLVLKKHTRSSLLTEFMHAKAHIICG